MRTLCGALLALLALLALASACDPVEDDPDAGEGGTLGDSSIADDSADRDEQAAGAGVSAGASASGRGGASGASGAGGSLPIDRGVVGGPPALRGPLTALDVLFVVDNSGSMREEQALLAQELPRLIERLLSGIDLDGDGAVDLRSIADVHLGVVTSDMGLVGVAQIENCAGRGDDGRLQHAPSSAVAGCAESYPTFLEHRAGDDPASTASDLACIATVGTQGCGFEQQLEAALKALSSSDQDGFLGDVDGSGRNGHGEPSGVNTGFLRNDPDQGLSAIAVVVVSDEEDCSSRDTAHLTPDVFLPPDDPLRMQGLNLRCHLNPDHLYEVGRYVDGLRALRSGNEQLVFFAAIIGVPPETVSASALDFDYGDRQARSAFYDEILAHPRMQPVIDDRMTPTQFADDGIVPSCESANGRAYPPHRIVEVARGFEQNGLVQSICEPNFGPAIDAITSQIVRALFGPDAVIATERDSTPPALSGCGDGVIDVASGEACEPTQPVTFTCESLGMGIGTVACGLSCQLVLDCSLR